MCVRKADAKVDYWLRNVAPSTELRRWFGHDPDRWDEFRRRYRAEIEAEPAAFYEVVSLSREDVVTLLFGARDREHNQAVELRELLNEALGAGTDGDDPASSVCYADRR